MEHRKNIQQIPNELDECRAYWQWAQKIPVLRDYLYKILNEGKRSPIFGRHSQMIGWRKGLPDYHYPVSNGKFHGFWLEMKRRDNKGKIHEDQRLWIEKLLKIDQYATVAYGWEDAVEKTLRYINNQI